MATRSLFSYILKREKKTSVDVEPETKPSVTVVDVGTADTERTGAITIKGATYTSGGRRVSGTGTVTQIEGTADTLERIKQQKQVAEQLERERIREQQQEQIRQAVARENVEPLPDQFYYKSEAGYGFNNEPRGVQYYQVTEQGQIVRRITPEEAQYYNLKPTKELQASENKQTLFQKIVQSKPVQTISKTSAKIESIGNVFEGEKVYTGTLPIIPAVSLNLFPTSTRFVGVTQTVRKNEIASEILYVSTRQGIFFETTETGVVKSLSTFKNLDEITLVKSASTGRVIARERLGVTTYPKKMFSSIEGGIPIKQSETAFIYGGVGKSQTLFKAVSIGKVEGQFTKINSLTESRLGKVYAQGILKESSIPRTVYFESFPSNYQTPPPIELVKQQALKSAVTSIPPISSTKSLVGVSTFSTSQIPLTSQKITQKTFQIQIPVQKQTIFQVTIPQTRTRQRISTITSTREEIKITESLLSKSLIQTKQTPLLKTLVVTQQTFKPRVEQAQILKTQRIQKTSFKSTFPKTIPILFPRLKKGKEPTETIKPVKLYVKEKGIFRFKGLFKTPKKAVARGVDITQQSISRSFKIAGANAGLPIGYRRSRKKGQKNVFVELSKTALSQFGEQFEIQTARKMKGGRKRK